MPTLVGRRSLPPEPGSVDTVSNSRLFRSEGSQWFTTLSVTRADAQKTRAEVETALGASLALGAAVEVPGFCEHALTLSLSLFGCFFPFLQCTDCDATLSCEDEVSRRAELPAFCRGRRAPGGAPRGREHPGGSWLPRRRRPRQESRALGTSGPVPSWGHHFGSNSGRGSLSRNRAGFRKRLAVPHPHEREGKWEPGIRARRQGHTPHQHLRGRGRGGAVPPPAAPPPGSPGPAPRPAAASGGAGPPSAPAACSLPLPFRGVPFAAPPLPLPLISYRRYFFVGFFIPLPPTRGIFSSSRERRRLRAAGLPH